MMQDYAYSKSDIGELDDSFFVKVPMDDDEEDEEDENDRVLGKIRGEIYFAELDNDDFPW